jgi:hypothetical protein
MIDRQLLHTIAVALISVFTPFSKVSVVQPPSSKLFSHLGHLDNMDLGCSLPLYIYELRLQERNYIFHFFLILCLMDFYTKRSESIIEHKRPLYFEYGILYDVFRVHNTK